MRRRQTHLQGRRGQAFLDLIRGVPREQIIHVSIDVHKYYHQVLIHNGYGDILEPSFKIDIFQSGFDRLCSAIETTVTEAEARVLFIGMEPTGHYFENLARHLLECYPHIRLVNSYAVKLNRNQKMLRAQKTNEIDLCSIGDLLLRNECFPYRPLEGPYLHLQNWVRFREAKVKARTALKNQIIGHLDRIFPGLVRPNRVAQQDHPPLFARLWDCQMAQHLVRLCPNPHQLVSMIPDELNELFHAHHWRMGLVTARRIIHFAQQVLLPDEQVIAARLPQLEIDLALLDSLTAIITHAEQQMAHYLAQTKGQILTGIKGIGVVHVARYVAGIGNPEAYEHAGQTFKRSGLISGRNDSGIHQSDGAGHRTTKVGDSHCRAALVELTRGLCLWQPYFHDYKTRLQERGKHPAVALVATARKVNGVLFALMRDQEEFHPYDAQGRPMPPYASVRARQKSDNRHSLKQSTRLADTSLPVVAAPDGEVSIP